MLLAFDDNGPGPVVVLLHGFPFDRSMWSAQVADVAATYRLITPDLRGFGETAAPEGVYTMEAMADDVIDLLNAMQLTEPVVLGGLSMGGYVALAAVAKYPDRFRALMLMDTKATADTPEAARAREELAATVEATASAQPVVEAMLPRLFSHLTYERRPQVLVPIRGVMARARPRAVAGALRGMAVRPDRTAALGSIRVPTLVLVGADDVITPPADSRAMADAIPGARLEVVPEAGHLAPVENPAAVNAAVLGFLNGLG
jgi:pimeloyl-ACP methyl ester carboxylesterase